MSELFICYRRDDTSGHAGRLLDRLSQEFGPGRVFMDVVGIEPGVKFKARIEEAIGAASVVVVLIGMDWLTARDSRGDYRLADPRDFIRLEIATALQTGKRVIPVLVRGARMPLDEDLSQDIRELASLSAVELSETRWEYDVSQLVTALKQIIRSGPQASDGAIDAAAEKGHAGAAAPVSYRLEYEARSALAAGVDAVARTVGATLGPRGQFVQLRSDGQQRRRTRDGLAISAAFSVSDPVEQEGVELVHETALDVRAAAGGGVTTMIVLAHALVMAGVEAERAGHRRPQLMRGIREAVDQAIAQLIRDAEAIADAGTLGRVVASIVDDANIADALTGAINSVGTDGVVHVEEGFGYGIDLEYTEGMRFDQGYLTREMATDMERAEVILEDPFILLADGKLSSVRELLPVLEAVLQKGKPILVIAKDVEGEALATLVINVLRGTFRGAAVKAPGFGERRARILEDIAILTGGLVVGSRYGLALEEVGLSELGRARRVVVGRDSTTIIDGAGEVAHIKARIEQIREEIVATDSEVERAALTSRLAKFSGGVAVIKVGGVTETAKRESIARCEEAIAAVSAAVAGGFVAGGGAALVHSGRAIDAAGDADEDVAAGSRLVAAALATPLVQIAANAGMDPSPLLASLREAGPLWGFDAMTGRVLRTDDESAPIDPLTVTRHALLHATALTEQVLTTQGVISDRGVSVSPVQGASDTPSGSGEDR